MRLLKLGIYHAAYLQKFYEARPDLENQTYAVQHRALIEDGFGSADFWTQGFDNLGYETTDIIANADLLQTAWARENDLNFGDEQLFEIATAQIKSFRPDVLLIADYSTFPAEFLRNIRRECSSIRLILGWCGAAYNNYSIFREWDIALSCVPEIVSDFRAQGLTSFHVNHAFAPRILDQINLNSPPQIDFAFVGSIAKQNKFHLERERLLLELIKSTNLQIWADVKRPTFRQRRNTLIRRRAQTVLPRQMLNALPLLQNNNAAEFVDSRLARRAHSPIFGLEMFQKLRDSRVVFNNHIDVSPFSASNMRMFEATGVGACLLTDWKENLPDLFKPETEVWTYRTAAECAEKADYLLAHENERRAIAAAGQRRTLREHTFENRVAQIDKIIRNYINEAQ